MAKRGVCVATTPALLSFDLHSCQYNCRIAVPVLLHTATSDAGRFNQCAQPSPGDAASPFSWRADQCRRRRLECAGVLLI